MNNDIVSLYFLVVALILFLVLVFVYKMMMAIGKLDKRLEQLAHHLRDLNLYEFHPGENGIFGPETELGRAADRSTDESLTPSGATDTAKPSSTATGKNGAIITPAPSE